MALTRQHLTAGPAPSKIQIGSRTPKAKVAMVTKASVNARVARANPSLKPEFVAHKRQCHAQAIGRDTMGRSLHDMSIDIRPTGFLQRFRRLWQ